MAGEYENEIFSLLVRHMNSISRMLMQDPTNFAPIFNVRQVHGREHR